MAGVTHDDTDWGNWKICAPKMFLLQEFFILRWKMEFSLPKTGSQISSNPVILGHAKRTFVDGEGETSSNICCVSWGLSGKIFPVCVAQFHSFTMAAWLFDIEDKDGEETHLGVFRLAPGSLHRRGISWHILEATCFVLSNLGNIEKG